MFVVVVVVVAAASCLLSILILLLRCSFLFSSFTCFMGVMIYFVRVMVTAEIALSSLTSSRRARRLCEGVRITPGLLQVVGAIDGVRITQRV